MTSVSAKHFVDWRPTVASLIPPVGGTLFPTSNCFPQTALLRDWGNGKPETTLRIYPIAQKSVAFAVRALSNQESTQSLTQCDPTAIKYRDHSHLDTSQVTVCAEQLVWPNFEAKILREDEDSVNYVDLDGCARRYSKTAQVIPAGLKWPITNWNDWYEFKEQRMRLDNIHDRLPSNWPELVREYSSRTYPLTLGGYPNGLFGSLTHLMGYENLFISYSQQPELVQDILARMTEVWLALWEEILAEVDVDMCHFWEDISFGKGSMISPATFRQFLTPYYQKLTDFLRSKEVDVILVDTDGDCNELIPLFLEAGITGLYPMEASAGMDVVAVRKKFPDLQLMGGIPKGEIALGEKRIREILEPVRWLLTRGGYTPYGDHLIPPEVHWNELCCTVTC